MRKIVIKHWFSSLFICAITLVVIVYAVGVYFTKPAQKAIAEAPAELGAESIIFENIHGWYHQSDSSNACVLLLHGVRSNRTSMIKRAAFLKDLGYSVLLIDLQAHGETPGDQITFGFKESDNVKSAVHFLRETKRCSKVGAIGVSLGGAASLLGHRPADVDALILESVYPSIEQAIFDRLDARFGAFLAKLFSPVLYEQIPLKFNIQLNQLRPLDAIQHIKSPVLIISGTADKHTRVKETEQLFSAAPEPKQLWLIKDAAHEDLYRFSGSIYELEIRNFLTIYLNENDSSQKE